MSTETSGKWARTALGITAFGAFTICVACSSAESTGSTSEGVCGTEVYDWHDFPTGNSCVKGASMFFTAHFGAPAGIPALSQYGDNGGCKSPGACLIWLDNVLNSGLWEKVSGTPTLFDMAVFPPVSGNPYGHVAVVDHVSNGEVFVMDDNYQGPLNAGQKATCVHTVSWAPYGYYHWKGAGSPAPNCSQRSGWNCWNDGVIGGVVNTNYDCRLGQAAPVASQVCAYGCKIEPNGVADICNPAPLPDCSHRSGWNCGNDGVINGNADTNYYCNYGQVAPVEAVVCTYGCAVMPNGVQDHCNAK